MKDLFGVLFNLFSIGAGLYILLMVYGKIRLPDKANKAKFDRNRMLFLVCGWILTSISILQLAVTFLYD